MTSTPASAPPRTPREPGRDRPAIPQYISSTQWDAIQRAAPLALRRRLRGRAASYRQFIDVVLWVAWTDLSWKDIPGEYGRWRNIYMRFIRWSQAGMWERVHRCIDPAYPELARALRQRVLGYRRASQRRVRAGAAQGSGDSLRNDPLRQGSPEGDLPVHRVRGAFDEDSRYARWKTAQAQALDEPDPDEDCRPG